MHAACNRFFEDTKRRMFVNEILTWTWFFFPQTPLHRSITNDSLLARHTPVRANRVPWSSASHTRFVARHTDATLIVLAQRTLGHTVFAVLDVHALRTMFGTRSVARELALRMTRAAVFVIHLVQVGQTVARVQTRAVEVKVFAV